MPLPEPLLLAGSIDIDADADMEGLEDTRVLGATPLSDADADEEGVDDS